MNKPKGKEDWLTQLEAARLAGVSTNTINYYVRNKRLEVVEVERQWLISPASLKKIYPDVG